MIKFKVTGNPRFLSHAQTAEVFRRACARAQIPIKYTQGFNPRPKMALPLPRTVGVESNDDLLCLGISTDTDHDFEQIRTQLAQQLPGGFELTAITPAEAKTSFVPVLATYVFDVSTPPGAEKLDKLADELLGSDSLELQRTAGPRSRTKIVNVRMFLKSIHIEKTDPDNTRVSVTCKCGPKGSIRVDEIMKLLLLEPNQIQGPIRRNDIKWQQNN
ncbi:MAG: TIGR03936 family radical SAM-associated protein [Planctomycetota bacterium]